MLQRIDKCNRISLLFRPWRLKAEWVCECVSMMTDTGKLDYAITIKCTMLLLFPIEVYALYMTVPYPLTLHNCCAIFISRPAKYKMYYYYYYHYYHYNYH